MPQWSGEHCGINLERWFEKPKRVSDYTYGVG
jgi:hypothetical protein